MCTYNLTNRAGISGLHSPGLLGTRFITVIIAMEDVFEQEVLFGSRGCLDLPAFFLHLLV